MFPEPTELLLIGCLIELIWTPKSKSNTSAPKTNSLTFWPKEISRVMSGIICCACLTLAISVLQIALLQWRNDLNKIQEKSESQQNRDLWWILLPGRHRSCRLQLQWARGRNITEMKIHGNQLLEKIDQGNLVKKQIFSKPLIITTMSNSWRASLQQIIQNWDYDRAWSSQEWNAEATTHDRSGQHNKTSWRMNGTRSSNLITRKFFSTEPRNP